MDNELLPLVRELCDIAVTRNDINTRRHRARFRKNYYAHAIAVVEAHAESSSELRHLELRNYQNKHQAKIDSIKSHMAWLVKKHPKPVKWQTMGLHKLRSLKLQGEGEYALAKHETMELSLKTTDRVKEILKRVNGSIRYDNGSIVNISVNGTPLTLKEIADHAAQYRLALAIGKMIEE
jgi:hypothetical protein